jgi:hypothetical protein
MWWATVIVFLWYDRYGEIVMSQYTDMKREEEAIEFLLRSHTKRDLVEMNRNISKTRREMFWELEELKERQRLIDKALGALYEKGKKDTVEFG